MFGAMIRWFKAMGYLLTGRIDSARRVIDTNPHVIRAKYDQIIKDKVSQIHVYKQAVAGLIAQQENKIAKVKSLSDEVGQLERLKAGALAKAKQTVEKLTAAGKAMEEIHQNEDYQKCLAAFNDFSATLAEKQDHIAENERDIGTYSKSIGDHKVQLQQILREMDKIKSEATDAVADVITSKQERDLADMLSGIAKDGSAEELQRLRQLRQETKAEARISKEMAGTDTKAQEAEFLEYARKTSASAEFDSLIGLAAATGVKEAPQAQPAAQEKKSSLPE
jgi:Zn finger protein HypA/HybF involved in hydrogenase expression